MEVILTKPVDKLGLSGQVVKVKNGYFNNFLGPQDMAVLASPAMMKRYEKLRKEAEAELEKRRATAQDQFDELNGQSIGIASKTNDKGVLFKALHEKDIVQTILDSLSVEVDSKAVNMPSEQVKMIGSYEFSVSLGSEFRAQMRLNVASTTPEKIKKAPKKAVKKEESDVTTDEAPEASSEEAESKEG